MGTRYKKAFDIAGVEDHPHACGDKLYLSYAVNYAMGSSPRVWGQVISSKFKRETHRIIPTRVGTSNFTMKWLFRGGDHPHACGDKTKEIKENSGFAKSTA